MPFSPLPLFPDRIKPKTTRRLAFLFLLDALLLSFQKLSSLSSDFLTLFSPPEQGIISHLSFYAKKLCLAANLDNTDPQDMAEQIKRRFLEFYALQFTQSAPESSYISFGREIETALQHLFQTLTPFFEKSRCDENLLLYLLEHREEYNRYLGERAVETLCIALFPKGQNDFYETMRDRFTERGLEEFFQEKEKSLFMFSWNASAP